MKKVSVNCIPGGARNYEYTYESKSGGAVPGDRLESITLPKGKKAAYGYDDLGRQSGSKLLEDGQELLQESYEYQAGINNDRTTGYIKKAWYAWNGGSSEAEYTYDAGGNITGITEAGQKTTYEYDEQGRLKRENNQALDFTKTYEYDAAGNISVVREYEYTTGTMYSAGMRRGWRYCYINSTEPRAYLTGLMFLDSAGFPILGEDKAGNYDNLGNPCNYGGNVVQWTRGRQMSSFGAHTYEYDAEGNRTRKVVNGTTTYTYNTQGGRLNSEVRDGGIYYTHHIFYSYDATKMLNFFIEV